MFPNSPGTCLRSHWPWRILLMQQNLCIIRHEHGNSSANLGSLKHDSRKQVTAVLWDHPWFPQKTSQNRRPGAHQSSVAADSAQPGHGQVTDKFILGKEE